MEDQKNETTERLDELGSGLTRNDKGSIYTLTIIGQIEGHQVAPDTVKLNGIVLNAVSYGENDKI